MCTIEHFLMWCHAVLQHGCFYSNGYQYSFMQASFYIIVRNRFLHELLHSWFRCMVILACARMMRVTALDIQVSLRNPTAMFNGGQHDIIENALYVYSSHYYYHYYYLKFCIQIKGSNFVPGPIARKWGIQCILLLGRDSDEYTVDAMSLVMLTNLQTWERRTQCLWWTLFSGKQLEQSLIETTSKLKCLDRPRDNIYKNERLINIENVIIWVLLVYKMYTGLCS